MGLLGAFGAGPIVGPGVPPPPEARASLERAGYVVKGGFMHTDPSTYERERAHRIWQIIKYEPSAGGGLYEGFVDKGLYQPVPVILHPNVSRVIAEVQKQADAAIRQKQSDGGAR